jgi:hypothetical protein
MNELVSECGFMGCWRCGPFLLSSGRIEGRTDETAVWVPQTRQCHDVLQNTLTFHVVYMNKVDRVAKGFQTANEI